MKVIQLLNWKLESIERELENIKNQGFDTIQINPMQPFKMDKVFHWWSSYQPLGFRVGNMFGSKEDLKRLCDKAREYDIDIVVDVVLNHVANKDDKHPCEPSDLVDREILDHPEFFKTKILLKNGDNRWDATTYNIGLPGLDLSNDDLQNIMFRYLNELKDCGVKGFRFDAAKHIGLPSDGVNFFKRVKMFLELNGLFGYGEFLGGDMDWRDEMTNYIDIHCPATSKVSDRDKQVAFLGSHDTFLNFDTNFHTRNFTNDDLIYIYRKLRNMFDKVLVYVSPLDEEGPYCKNTKNLTCDEVLALDERKYFNDLYLDSDRIKEINNVNDLVLKLRRSL